MSEVDYVVEWLRWRIEEVAEKRKGSDYAAMSHGGASFDVGYRAGKEEAFRDALDMFESTFGEKDG